jgi:hypothetical protein
MGLTLMMDGAARDPAPPPHEPSPGPRLSPRTGLPLIPKGPPLPTERCAEPPSAALLHAVAQFNAGEFWEAHETLEELWRHEEDAVRSLYQGILQVGVGFHHLLRGNYHGATAKLRAGLDRLAPYGPVCRGVDVAGLAAAAERRLRILLEAGPAGLADAARAPLPRIEIVPQRRAPRDRPGAAAPGG